MKLFIYLGLLTMVFALSGCPFESKNDSPSPQVSSSKDTTCQSGLVRHFRQDQNGKIYDVKYEYEFNKLGYISKIKSSFSGDHINPKVGSKPLIQTAFFLYDNDGYLLSKKTIVQNTDVLIGGWSFDNETFEYQNGKLIKAFHTDVSISANDTVGKKFPLLYTFDYDGNGRLIRRNIIIIGSEYNREYLYGYDTEGYLNSYKEGNEFSTHVFFKGKRTETISYNGEKTKYFYDSENQLIKTETQLLSGKTINSNYTYDNKELPFIYLPPTIETYLIWKVNSFKGHPLIPSVWGSTKHNYVQLKSEGFDHKYVYQYNNSGKPISVTFIREETGKKSITSTIVIDYCQ